MKRAIVMGLILAGIIAPAEGHKANHREVVTTQGTAFCPEDARLVPVKHHGYKPERTGGWVYRCRNFEKPGRFAP